MTKNKVNISLKNTKLGAKIPSINIPAGLTCRPDAPCLKGCYALKGNWKYDSVKKSLKHNYDLYFTSKENYFNSIIEYLNDKLVSYKFFRWHASGDIINYDYLLGIIKVAKKCPQTKFLAFTKKFMLVNLYLSLGHRLPSNLKIVFSAWDKDFKVDNPYNLPVTYVDFGARHKNMNADIPDLAIPCIGDCQHCQSCWSLRKGQSVVFHKH